MKKGILIFSVILVILIVMIYGFINTSNLETDQLKSSVSEALASNTLEVEKINNRIFTDFIYDVGTRFNPIKKSDLDKVKSFNDFIGEDHAQRIVSYNSLKVILIIDDKKSEIRETGNSGELTSAQLKLLQSFKYSTNLMIWADYQEKDSQTGQIVENHWTPYLTIVPEKQAKYINGLDSLKKYLKDNSEDARVNVEADKLKPAKLFFTVTKDGAIENVKLDRSSGYPSVDKTMIELILKTQETWEPAENTEGEKVDQELVVSFGLMGC